MELMIAYDMVFEAMNKLRSAQYLLFSSELSAVIGIMREKTKNKRMLQ